MTSRIRGRLATGVGRGTYFTQLAWARRQFIDKLGIDPFPGTLNVIVDDPESLAVWIRLRNKPGVRIDNPNGGPRDCSARCYQVSIQGRVDAAIVLPEVEGYPTDQIEIIAAIEVRDALGIASDDLLTLEIFQTPRPLYSGAEVNGLRKYRKSVDHDRGTD